jgi:UbiD family decarboxylase
MDLERFRLRRFLDSLPAHELERRPEPIELADVAAVHEGNAKAVWFSSAAGAELAANVTASRPRLALAFGTTPERLLGEVLARLARPQPVSEVKDAPVQAVVESDPDLTQLPVHLQHEFDGAPYISASMDFTRDAERGLTNVGIRRLMLRGRREAGVDLNAPSDLRAIYQAAVARRERLPIAFVVGSHPIDHVAATMRLPGDELSLIAALRGAPLAVV